MNRDGFVNKKEFQWMTTNTILSQKKIDTMFKVLKLYILCFTIGLLFCLAFQKSIEDLTITPSFVTYVWIITYFLIGLCLSFFVFVIAVNMISDDEED